MRVYTSKRSTQVIAGLLIIVLFALIFCVPVSAEFPESKQIEETATTGEVAPSFAEVANDPIAAVSFVLDRLPLLEKRFPEGALYGADHSYQVVLPGLISNAGGCQAFVHEGSDLLADGSAQVVPYYFTPIRTEYHNAKAIKRTDYDYSFETVYPGDILAFEGHACLVTGRDAQHVYVAEANVNGGRVSWTRTLTPEEVASARYIFTRYPTKIPMSSVGVSADRNVSHVCPCAQFEDMPEYGTPEHEAIDYAFENGYTSGVSETLFGTGKTLTRAQACTFLYAASGKPAVKAAFNQAFSDVPGGKWFSEAVRYAASEGNVSGYTDGSFKPNGTLTRGQILVIFYARAGKPAVTIENPYSDVPAGKWYTDAALWAYETGIEKGDDGIFAQGTACTRETFVLYLYRVMTGNVLAE